MTWAPNSRIRATASMVSRTMMMVAIALMVVAVAQQRDLLEAEECEQADQQPGADLMNAAAALDGLGQQVQGAGGDQQARRQAHQRT